MGQTKSMSIFWSSLSTEGGGALWSSSENFWMLLADWPQVCDL